MINAQCPNYPESSQLNVLPHLINYTQYTRHATAIRAAVHISLLHGSKLSLAN